MGYSLRGCPFSVRRVGSQGAATRPVPCKVAPRHKLRQPRGEVQLALAQAVHREVASAGVQGHEAPTGHLPFRCRYIYLQPQANPRPCAFFCDETLSGTESKRVFPLGP